MSCLIDSGITFDCSALPTGGLEQELYLYNLVDWQAATVTLGVTDSEITDIVNASGKQAYLFEVADETNIVPSSTLRVIEGNADQYDHAIQFAVFENDQAARNNIDNMRFAAIVGIVLRKDGTGLVYGENGGMYLTEVIDNPSDPNTGNIALVTVATKPTQPPEPYLPRTIFDTDAATTRTLIRGLTTPGV